MLHVYYYVSIYHMAAIIVCSFTGALIGSTWPLFQHVGFNLLKVSLPTLTNDHVLPMSYLVKYQSSRMSGEMENNSKWERICPPRGGRLRRNQPPNNSMLKTSLCQLHQFLFYFYPFHKDFCFSWCVRASVIVCG